MDLDTIKHPLFITGYVIGAIIFILVVSYKDFKRWKQVDEVALGLIVILGTAWWIYTIWFTFVKVVSIILGYVFEKLTKDK